MHAGVLSAQGLDISENEDAVTGEVATAAAAAANLPLSEWVQKIGFDVVGHHDYDTYAIIYDDVTTKAQTDKKCVSRRMLQKCILISVSENRSVMPDSKHSVDD